MPRGKFIVFEGLDGSGQTTQAKLLARYLRGRGKKVLLTKEPTDIGVGRFIRAVLQKKIQMEPLALQLIFCADRAQHLANVIEPALQVGKWVVCDRYALSTLAYGSLGAPLDVLKAANKDFRRPDLTILLDVPAEVAVTRIRKGRGGKIELFEQAAMLKKVRRNYLKLRNYFPRTRVVNGDRPINEVAAEVQKIVTRLK